MKEPEKSIYELFEEMTAHSALSKHPDQARIDKAMQKIGIIFADCLERLQSLAKKPLPEEQLFPLIMSEARLQADAFLRLIDVPSGPDPKGFTLAKLPPIHPAVVLAIVTKTDSEAIRNAETIIQSKRGSRPRPSRRRKKERQEVLSYFQRWQAKPGLYKSDAAFIKDMLEKTDISRGETIRKWLKEFRAQPVK